MWQGVKSLYQRNLQEALINNNPDGNFISFDCNWVQPMWRQWGKDIGKICGRTSGDIVPFWGPMLHKQCRQRHHSGGKTLCGPGT